MISENSLFRVASVALAGDRSGRVSRQNRAAITSTSHAPCPWAPQDTQLWQAQTTRAHIALSVSHWLCRCARCGARTVIKTRSIDAGVRMHRVVRPMNHSPEIGFFAAEELCGARSAAQMAVGELGLDMCHVPALVVSAEDQGQGTT